MKDAFRAFAHRMSDLAGAPATFFLAVALVLGWAVSGPFFGFSETWQLVINTGTTIVTFLMIFLVQSTQNRDAVALQLKLDELIRATAGARNSMVDLEDVSDHELVALQREFRSLREHYSKSETHVSREHERRKRRREHRRRKEATR